MGIYGHAFKQKANEYYSTEQFFDDFYNNYYAAEALIDHNLFTYTILSEAEGEQTGLAVRQRTAKKYYYDKDQEKISNKIKNMLEAFLKWVKSMWDKLVEKVKELIKKIQDAHLRDKAMGKLFGKLEYKDIEAARDKGWKGLPIEKTVCVNPATLNDSEIARVYNNEKKDKEVESLRDVLDAMDQDFNNDNLDSAKENYKRMQARCKETLEVLKKSSILKTLSNRESDEWINQMLSGFRQAYGGEPKNTGKVLFVYMAVKNPNNNKYGWPNPEQFVSLKKLTISGDEYVGKIRNEEAGSHIKDFEAQIKKDINEFEKEENKEYSFNSNTKFEINNYILKAKLLMDKTQLQVMQNIVSEVVTLVRFQITLASETYVKLFTSLKAFSAVGKLTGKDKEESKDSRAEEEKKEEAPNEEPAGATA